MLVLQQIHDASDAPLTSISISPVAGFVDVSKRSPFWNAPLKRVLYFLEDKIGLSLLLILITKRPDR